MRADKVYLTPAAPAPTSHAARCRTQPMSPQPHVRSTKRAQPTPCTSNSTHYTLHWLPSAQLAQLKFQHTQHTHAVLGSSKALSVAQHVDRHTPGGTALQHARNTISLTALQRLLSSTQ